MPLIENAWRSDPPIDMVGYSLPSDAVVRLKKLALKSVRVLRVKIDKSRHGQFWQSVGVVDTYGPKSAAESLAEQLLGVLGNILSPASADGHQ